MQGLTEGKKNQLRNQKQKLIEVKTYAGMCWGKGGHSCKFLLPAAKFYCLQHQFSIAGELPLPRYSYKKGISGNSQCW